MSNDDITKTAHLITEHLKYNHIYVHEPPWALKTSPLGDRGLFATRDIYPGETIFIDHPLIAGPRSGIDIPVKCVVCHSNEHLKECSKGCGLSICGLKCEESKAHQDECGLFQKWIAGSGSVTATTRYLTPVRSLLMTESQKELAKRLKCHSGAHHGFEVDELKKLGLKITQEEEEFMRFICGVLDANAFEIVVGNENDQTSLRGLFPLSGLANHRCYANATHVFDKDRNMITRAATFIPKDGEIFHTYSRLTWTTFTRRYHLQRTKHFGCNCARCADPTEFGSNLAAIFCNRCKGLCMPINPLKLNSDWRCHTCGNEMTNKEVGFISSVFGSRLGSFEDRDIDGMIGFIDRNQLPECNHVIVHIKLKLIWTLGYMEGFSWKEISEMHLEKKEKYCHDVLQLLETLRSGRCKLRGLILYEVCCCMREKHRRIELQKHSSETNNNYTVSSVAEQEIQNYLNECGEILKFDVSAPQEIKDMW